MSQYTENYHLEKPESNDNFENFRENYNSNMDIIDQHLGGGGGGSSVSWQQLQVTGDKIATIRISGIDTDVYSPNARTFSMAISRANIDSGEDYSTIFGKIKKYFADLKAVAFTANASDLTNDAGFITNTVNNLANYYLKSETYTQAEVNALIGAITTIHFEVVQTLPTSDIQTNVIYLVPKSTAGTNDVYDEYINMDGTSAGWELIGSTQVDLSNYYTKTQTDTLLDGKVSDVEVNGSSVVNAQGVAEVTAVQDNPTFTEASTRANIASGETFATILGKIKKWFSDLASMFVSKTGDTMSGNLNLEKADGEISVKCQNTTKFTSAYIYSANSGEHGIWSNGYNDGTFHNSALWLVNRGTDGSVKVNGTSVPSNGGTVALTSDIPTDTNDLTNGAGYITANDTAKTAKMLFSQSDNMGAYETNDTHILQLGYLGADDYSNVILLVSSSFYGVQHGSTDILNVMQDYTRDARYFYHVKLDGRTERTFYGEQIGDKFYIWVYCVGGNSYGIWNVSVIQSNGNRVNWYDDKQKNQPVRATWSEFGYGGIVYKAKNADSATDSTKVLKTGDTMTGNLIIQGTQSSPKSLTLGIEYSGGMSFGGNAILPQTKDANGMYQNTLPNKNGTFAMTSDIPSVPTKVSQLNNDSSFGRIISTNMNGQNTCQVGIPSSAFGSYTRYAFLLYTCAGGAIRAYLCTMQTNNYVISCNAALMAGSELSVSSSATQATIDGVQYNLMSFKFPSNVYDTTQVITHYSNMIIRSTQT